MRTQEKITIKTTITKNYYLVGNGDAGGRTGLIPGSVRSP